ncbi:SHOCT domain-containing protein [Lactobacillus mulieris]|uniref:SHOCT domain-containing protein n=1 Tax=Lactobacillus mulieris TaxID=2508708 RepID=A0AAW5WY88_9LACO|nr:SHOCT domain-containing protein [Lactobacillus mulieris]MCZ3622117.1 SHOCT domain-containing protein [Lactobacillus mulieris]MCZ3623814.1 SHOCT domain-containing protein [Lactobacillus mulieris]MCZ3636124.1 SHOCT domain-containing protein [Lactobacillus mulieris]MCZ3689945.1 SHOCT domain-containing protein [Lactobacillus mulieris]MCZ3696785.1 SHOCT domain-containing protein [Lactobacillus mulieris]
MIRYNIKGFFLHQPSFFQVLVNDCDHLIPESEIMYVALKGGHREYLICTEKNLYIVKRGYMTGHTFGANVFKLPYERISNVNIQKGFMGGYFQVVAPGVNLEEKAYWSSDHDKSPQHANNCISLPGETYYSAFAQASKFISERIEAISNNKNVLVEDEATKLEKYKKLLDENIITQDEFQKLKEKLLGL